MHRQRIIEQRDQLLKEIEALRNKVAGLEMSLALIDNHDIAPGGRGPSRGSVKATLLGLLKEVGTTGLNAATAVEIASRRGIALDRGTVSSMLSRLKKDEVVSYEGDKYRLKEFTSAGPTGPTGPAPSTGPTGPRMTVVGPDNVRRLMP